MTEALDLISLVADRDIRSVLAMYCRGIDRVDLTLVRACYHHDAIDDHGRYRGDVDGLIEWLAPTLARFDRTMHFLGTCNVEIRGDVAAAETYAVAYHRGVNPAGQLADHIVGLRYLDRFERRSVESGDEPTWRIARRTCALEWRRDDPVTGPGAFPTGYTMGERGSNDPVYSLFDPGQ
jgi:SnoaL-like domain